MNAKPIACAATLVLGFAVNADAGHSRCCRPCHGNTGYSQTSGGWYHFQSTATRQGMYVPYAQTSPSYVPLADNTAFGPPVAQGTGIVQRFSYEPQATGSVTATSTTTSRQPYYPPQQTRLQRGIGQGTAWSEVGETVNRRLHPGYGWRR